MNANLGFPIEIDFLEKLKSHSAAAHKKLENLSVSASILSPDMKIEDYCYYLSLMHDVHKSTEEIIFPILINVIADLQERKKTYLIESDHSYLKYKKQEPVLIFKYKLLNIPFSLGILYVIEGSSLGGRYILKNAEKIPGLDKQKGVSYFTGYGHQTGIYWKTFTNLLQEYEHQNNCSEEIIEGAVYAFDCIYNHFQSTVQNEN
jgi:heme oxygenase